MPTMGKLLLHSQEVLLRLEFGTERFTTTLVAALLLDHHFQ